jgi:hypothetical protein
MLLCGMLIVGYHCTHIVRGFKEILAFGGSPWHGAGIGFDGPSRSGHVVRR